jgi:MerC mercury resistance protein
MPTRAMNTGLIDRAAIALSGLCLVHCLATALILGTLSSLGGFLGSPLIHETGLAIAIVLGGVALGRGVLEHQRFLPPSIGAMGLGMMAGALSLPHGSGEVTATVAGVGLLALGHVLNRMSSLA